MLRNPAHELSAVEVAHCRFDYAVPDAVLAAARAEDAAFAADPRPSLISQVQTMIGQVEYRREALRDKIKEAREGTNIYALSGVATLLKSYRREMKLLTASKERLANYESRTMWRAA